MGNELEGTNFGIAKQRNRGIIHLERKRNSKDFNVGWIIMAEREVSL